MNRRDIIIIAVLINAGLLIVLFASALKSNPEAEIVAAPSAVSPPSSELVLKQEKPSSVQGDEVDQVLREFTQAAAPSVATTSQASGFAEDLQAIITPQTSSLATQPQLTSPVVASAPENVDSPAFTEVKVKKGDVLEKIARQHRTSVDQIMKVNHLKDTRLKIGQTLKIPQGVKKTETASAAPLAPAAAPSESGVKYYTVKNGDNPWTIAVKNRMKVEELLKLNNMDEEKARKLKAGDQLRIR